MDTLDRRILDLFSKIGASYRNVASGRCMGPFIKGYRGWTVELYCEINVKGEE